MPWGQGNKRSRGVQPPPDELHTADSHTRTPSSSGSGGVDHGPNDVWYSVDKTKTASIGHLPARHQEKIIENAESLTYYHYRLNRTDVEALVREEGDFIVRKGTRDAQDGFTVSVRWGGRMLHFPVYWVGANCCFEGKAYTFVQNLVHYYMDSQEPVTAKSGAQLRRGKTRVGWEILSRDLELGKKLGSGAFGAVYLAKLTRSDDIEMVVAVKKADDTKPKDMTETKIKAAKEEQLEEARMMRELSGHPNLVKSFGITIDTEFPYAVMEFMDGGSLHNRLMCRNGEPRLSIRTKVKASLEIARGLSYIGRCQYVHRDIAARNILFSASKHDDIGISKIIDFGLTRKLADNGTFTGPENENVPIVWTAYESLVDHVWTKASDVWSMGVIIWEIFSDGCKPYCDIENQDRNTIVEELRKGLRLKAAKGFNMPVNVESIMEQCFSGTPSLRPSANDVCRVLLDELCTMVNAP